MLDKALRLLCALEIEPGAGSLRGHKVRGILFLAAPRRVESSGYLCRALYDVL